VKAVLALAKQVIANAPPQNATANAIVSAANRKLAKIRAVANLPPSPTERGCFLLGGFMTASTVMPDLWQDYHQRLLSYVAKRISNTSDAEDIVQTVFLKIQQHPPQLKTIPQLEAWLLQVTKNTLVDYWRKTKPTTPLLDEHDYAAEQDPEPNENPWLNLSCCLLAMMKDLPEKYKQAVELADLQEIKHKDIATMMGISESGVKSRVKRGREKLREMLISCCSDDCQCHEDTPEHGCCHSSSQHRTYALHCN